MGMGRHDSLPERVGSTEVSNLRLANVTVAIRHKDNRVASGLPGEESRREVPEEGQPGAEGVTKGLEMMFLLGVDALEMGFLLLYWAVTTDNADTTASATLQAEP